MRQAGGQDARAAAAAQATSQSSGNDPYAALTPEQCFRLEGAAKLGYVTRVGMHARMPFSPPLDAHMQGLPCMLLLMPMLIWAVCCVCLVQKVFDAIAARYDLVNLFISAGHTSLWRRWALRSLGGAGTHHTTSCRVTARMRASLSLAAS